MCVSACHVPFPVVLLFEELSIYIYTVLLSILLHRVQVLPSIAKAVMESKLGLNPSEQGGELLVPVPKPSTDQVKEYLKAAKAHVTEAKKNLSHLRSDVNKVVRDIDDTAARNLLTRDLDKITEALNKQLEDLYKHKEKELGAA